MEDSKQMAVFFDKESGALGPLLRDVFKADELEEPATPEDSSFIRQEDSFAIQDFI